MIESEAEFLRFLTEECHYVGAKLTEDGQRYVAVAPLFATIAIVTGNVGDTQGYDNRWCYTNLPKALAAFNDWDGLTGEPTGWHRHPSSGRRVALDDGEYDRDGVRMSAGDSYVRA